MASKEFENKLILEEIEISDDDDDDSTDTQFKIDYELDGELMDLRLFPQNIMYEALGADWIAERNGITDPFLYKICEEVAKQPMKSLGDPKTPKPLKVYLYVCRVDNCSIDTSLAEPGFVPVGIEGLCGVRVGFGFDRLGADSEHSGQIVYLGVALVLVTLGVVARVDVGVDNR